MSLQIMLFLGKVRCNFVSSPPTILSCYSTFSLGKCLLSHSSFSWGHVWGHFLNFWHNKNMTMIKFPLVKWHGIVLSHMSSKDRSHERQSFSLKSNHSHQKFPCGNCQTVFHQKKVRRRIFEKNG
jgi:hypothetical protein